MINYEVMTGHFTVQRCLFGCNSMVILKKKNPIFSLCQGLHGNET